MLSARRLRGCSVIYFIDAHTVQTETERGCSVIDVHTIHTLAMEYQQVHVFGVEYAKYIGP